MKSLSSLFVGLGSVVLIACSGATRDADFPPEPRDSLTLDKLAGTYEFSDDNGKSTLTLDTSGRYAVDGTTPKGECRTTGVGSILTGNGGYLEIKLERDSCRDLVIYRTYKIEGAGTKDVTLVEEPDGAAGGTKVKQVFRKVSSKSKLALSRPWVAIDGRCCAAMKRRTSVVTAWMGWVLVAGCVTATSRAPSSQASGVNSAYEGATEPSAEAAETASASASGVASVVASASASAPRNPNACAPPDEGWGNYEPFQQLGRYRLALPKIEKAPERGFDVVVHFHMGDAIRRGVVQTAFPAVYLSLDVGEGSNKYKKEFLNNNAFVDLRASIEKTLRSKWGEDAHIGRLFLSSWSAGFGATTAILGRFSKDVDGIILLDSLYGPYAAGPEGEPAEGVLLTPPLEPVVKFARRAVAGEKYLFLSYSAIVPKGYASTGEVAAFLLNVLGLKGQAVNDSDEPRRLNKKVDAGSFHMRGYLGTDPKAHCDHLKYIRDALTLAHVGQ